MRENVLPLPNEFLRVDESVADVQRRRRHPRRRDARPKIAAPNDLPNFRFVHFVVIVLSVIVVVFVVAVVAVVVVIVVVVVFVVAFVVVVVIVSFWMLLSLFSNFSSLAVGCGWVTFRALTCLRWVEVGFGPL